MELESIALDHSAKLTVRGDLMDSSEKLLSPDSVFWPNIKRYQRSMLTSSPGNAITSTITVSQQVSASHIAKCLPRSEESPTAMAHVPGAALVAG